MLTHSIERILDAATLDEIGPAFLDAMRDFGFPNVTYAARFMLSLPRSLVQDDAVIISNLPEPVLERYRLATTAARTPPLWTEWVHRNDGAIPFQALVDAAGADAASPTLQLSRELGFEAVQIVSLRDKVLRSIGAVLLNPHAHADHAELARLWHRAGRDIRTLSWVMHMRLATMRPRASPPRLTPRQREVLEWRSAGKTVGEIATILGVTPATVEKHMRLAREALGVQTTPQAILKAHLAHELFPRSEDENPFR